MRLHRPRWAHPETPAAGSSPAKAVLLFKLTSDQLELILPVAISDTDRRRNILKSTMRAARTLPKLLSWEA
jgi:hypothetical protein